MCIVSMVHDHYIPIIPDITPTTPWVPSPTAPTNPLPGTVTINPFSLTTLPDPEIAELKELIKAFREDLKKAMELDIRLKQPDCVDPKKDILEERVAKLEAAIQALEAEKTKAKNKKSKAKHKLKAKGRMLEKPSRKAWKRGG